MSKELYGRNKNVLVVGTLGGIGKATTIELVNNGYNVYGLDISDICDISKVHYFKIDLSDESSITNAYNEIKEEISELYAIVNLSGIFMLDSLLEMPDEDLKKMLDINFLGLARINRIFFPLLKKKSKVLITSSEVGPLDPLPFNGIYTICKSLIEKYAFSLRMELNIFGIDVIVLRPGAIQTQLLDVSMKAIDDFSKRTVIHKDTSKRFKKIAESVESKHIPPAKIGKYINKIIKKKRPKYVYAINRNPLLRLLNILPDRLQVFIITKILKN